MKITIICVGKIKEKFYTEAVKEYSKRLSRYCSLNIIEVADEKTKEQASETEITLVKKKEGERILKALHEDGYVIALAINGTQSDSIGLAEKIEKLGLSGISHVYFIIGGSLGLSDEVLSRADEQLSFSKMTFPHQLMRVILLEQIYRSCRIIHHEPYHK
ncbi:MAG: 23S rRNA (pseudouridine(1915)-N(3))-methyltransferase RlmH [Lachnospiraceae bacterium]|nr:23S rRNA (pseudouridine(1915)-N(3))-methyltransferase RlmH [Agathobacter sp.]MDD6445920.1 23S rRNA (pseudouridine(1915)-N(3))-methyltransferase RlmH [Lachnospiraceae bacterium]MDY4893381.1 23S rRNA (pseudouridine(1915)-N(3))-methyltransferase RlmH [Agathobacter sp.]